MTKWIQKAVVSMKKKGTVGAFTKTTKKSGKSVAEQIKSTLKKGSKSSTLQKKRAVFAKNMRAIAAKKKR
jgi:hypothetical protein